MTRCDIIEILKPYVLAITFLIGSLWGCACTLFFLGDFNLPAAQAQQISRSECGEGRTGIRFRIPPEMRDEGLTLWADARTLPLMGDFDGDGRLGLIDYGRLQRCVGDYRTGPGVWDCEQAEMNGDNLVTDADVRRWLVNDQWNRNPHPANGDAQ